MNANAFTLQRRRVTAALAEPRSLLVCGSADLHVGSTARIASTIAERSTEACRNDSYSEPPAHELSDDSLEADERLEETKQQRPLDDAARC